MVRYLLSLALALAAVAGCCAPGLAQTPAFDAGQGTLRLSATLGASAAPLTGGLRWRVFAAHPDLDGSHALVVESSEPQPTLTVPPGDYVVHVALGLASAAKRVTLSQEVRNERLTLNAGALRIAGTLGDTRIDPSKLALAIYVPERNNPEGKLVYAKARAGEIRDFTGVSAPYEAPANPEIELPTGQLTVEECVSRIIDFLAALER